MAPPEKEIHPKLHEKFYNSLSEKQWSDRFDQSGLKTETIRKTFVSYSALIDFFFGRNLHIIATVTSPIAAGLTGRCMMAQFYMKHLPKLVQR